MPVGESNLRSDSSRVRSQLRRRFLPRTPTTCALGRRKISDDLLRRRSRPWFTQPIGGLLRRHEMPVLAGSSRPLRYASNRR